MFSLKQDERKAFEDYLLADGDANKQAKAMDGLVKGSLHHDYLKLLDKIKRIETADSLTPQERALLDTLIERLETNKISGEDYALVDSLRFKYVLLQFDAAQKMQDADKRKEMVDKIIKHYLSDLTWAFSHQKPVKEGTKNDDSLSSDDASNKRDSLDESLLEPTSERSSFDYRVKQIQNKIADAKANIAKYSVRKDDEHELTSAKTLYTSLCREQARSITQDIHLFVNSEEYAAKFDFTPFEPLVVYNFVCELASGAHKIFLSQLTNETFFKQFVAYSRQFMEEREKEAEKPEFKHSPKDFWGSGQGILDLFTLGQMDTLKAMNADFFSNDEQFCAAYFKKQFSEELNRENQSFWTVEEKLENLRRLEEYTRTHNLPKMLKMEFRNEILAAGPEIGQYDEQLFIAYLEDNEKTCSIFKNYAHNLKQVQKQRAQIERTKVQQYINSYAPRIETQSPLIMKYLRHFCIQEKGSLKKFEKYFESYVLAPIESEIRVLQAQDGLASLKDFDISLDLFRTISEKVILEFDETNKKMFGVDEEVTLEVNLKNIQQLYVRVFEFNTETYYKKNLQKFDTNVNLDGLEARIKEVREYSHPANILFHDTFKIEHLSGKTGIFIIEMMGNGMSARAVVKKGSLSLVHRSTIAGQQLFILDDQKRICKGGDCRTGVIMDGKFYAASKEKGRIDIPFAKSPQTTKLILIRDQFAEIQDFKREAERFEFAATFYLNQESMLVGSSTSILIRPKLLINGSKANLKMLKNCKAVLSITNYIDDIPVTKNFDSLTFTNDRELAVQFQVPPNLGSIHIKLMAQVQNSTTRKMESFTAEESFQLVQMVNNSRVCEAYLKREKGLYNAYLLGRNGEPLVKDEVQIELDHLMRKSTISTSLITNKDGCIHLGKLSGVKAIKVSNSKFNTRWTLPCQETKFNAQYVHPRSLTLLEGEDLVLPISLSADFTKPTREIVTLVRSLNNSVIEDCFSKVKIELIGDAESGYHQLRVDNMQQGVYYLSIVTGYMRKDINLEVKKGEYWEESDGFILMKDKLEAVSDNSQHILQFSQVGIANPQPGSKQHRVTVQLDNATKQVRVHAIATTFVQNNGSQLAQQLHNMLNWQAFSNSFMFRNQESIFISNKKVSDEIRYVFERKQLEGKLGNTLERPSLLIKKNFIKETSIDSETLNQGDHLDGHAFREVADYKHMKEKSALDCDSRLNSGRYTESTEMINFLKISPAQQFNNAPEAGDDNGEEERCRRTITFDINLSNYSQLYLLAVDRDSLVQRNIDLDYQSATTMRDLRLNKVLDDKKGITETRNTIKLVPQNDAFQQYPHSNFIEDITSSEVQLVDSICKIVEILEEIMKMNGLSHQDQEWDKFSFIKQWPTLSANEKDRYYSEYMCHEFNLYLRRRDTEYFDAVVKPFIQYNMEKQFIDHYLLNNFKECNRYVDFTLQKKLNALETCLLVDSLVRSGEGAKAAIIVNALNQQMESINESTAEKVTLRNKIFDLVLNLNTLNNVKGDLAKLQDKIKIREEEREREVTMMASLARRSSYGSEKEEEEEDRNYGTQSDASSDNERDEIILRSMAAPRRELLSASPLRNMRLQAKSAKPMMKKKMASKQKECFDSDDEDYYLEQERSRNVAINKQEFEEVEQTSEFMETHYYKQTDITRYPHLIGISQFWTDYANYLLKPVANRGAFISDNFIDCAVSKQQVFLIQFILDLPLEPSSDHKFTPDDQRGVTITAGSNMILYKKFIAEADLDLKRDIKVIHRYQQLVGGNESEQLSGRPDPFLSSTPYKCEVVLTNVSPKTKSFSLLYQIPLGAMPMFKSKYMKSHYMSLSPYTTQKVTFEFYFPLPGKFTHFPSNISVDQIVQARGEANILNVEKSRRITKIESFVDLLLTGTKADVLNFLENEILYGNEKKFDANDMLYLMKDKDFFTQAIQILSKRKFFHQTVWSYAIYHKDNNQAIREYLQFRDREMSTKIGTHFKSTLLTISPDNAAFGFNRFLEYHPMVNRRAHKVGGENSNRILNREFRLTYDSFLTTMAQKNGLTETDKMCFVYYLQLQDREQEAIALFRTIKEPADGELRIQYDYLTAYLDFFNREEKDFLKARAIVRKYDNFPITQWRMMFLAIEDQLNEIDGEFDDEELDPIEVEESKDFDTKIAEKRKENKNKSQKREPNLNSVEVGPNGTLKIESVNIKEVVVKYYNINAELMFTRAPFIKDNTEAFTYVMPFHTERKQMVPADADESQMNAIVSLEIPMPAKLQNLNLVIEINGGEKQQFKTFYSNQLKITTLESYGELKVAHATTGKALPKVYVKVFGLHKSTGKEFFFRDGYTDIRGKIEYAQTSGDKLKNVKRFAILVVSDQYGSKILECDPPKTESDQPVSIQSVLPNAQPVMKVQGYTYGNMESKMERLQNRQNYVQSKKFKK